VPLLGETRHFPNAQTLAQLKPGAFIINTSRGALIDTAALIDALKSGKLGGAALDVYEEEGGLFFNDLSGQVLQDDVLARLISLPNVLITSHQAFLTEEALRNIAETTLDSSLALRREASLKRCGSGPESDDWVHADGSFQSQREQRGFPRSGPDTGGPIWERSTGITSRRLFPNRSFGVPESGPLSSGKKEA
jgi:hypothetical protein